MNRTKEANAMALRNVAAKRPVQRGAQPFRWAVGFEGSFIPHCSVDQYEWTQHDRFWREDFKRVAHELGCKWLRYPVAWHLIEPAPGRFDWKWSDERIEFAQDLGIELFVDLVHFGAPTWLPEAFGDVEMPAALERFSRAFGKRYSGTIKSICPMNEPLITALFCGDVGLWPPHGRGLMSYTTVLSRVAQGVKRSINALRETTSDLEIFYCDALEYPTACAKALEGSAQMIQLLETDLAVRRHRRHIVLDLITGRVDETHSLFEWLTRHGFHGSDLKWFQREPVSVDVLGLDYYAHSEMELYPHREGEWRQRVPAKLTGLHVAARDYWERYRLPMMITETSACGSDEEKLRWLDFTLSDIRRLRADGVPVIGYTWWPAIDHLDWDGAMLHHIGRIHRAGLYSLERNNGELRRVSGTAADAFRKLAAAGDEPAGPLAEPRLDTAPASDPDEELFPTFNPRNPHMLDFPIIVHCHLRWDGVWQRPQQFLSRLSANHRVLFVEGPILMKEKQSRYELKPVEAFPNVTVLQMHLPESRFSDGAWVDQERRRLVREALRGPLAGQFENPVQWFYDPMAVVAFAGKLDEAAIVYDCMDQLSQFRFAPPEISARECLLLAEADVVFTGGRKLREAKKRHNSNCHFYGCGVEVEHFARAGHSSTRIPPDADFISRPILGYFGVVDERMDYELITKLADADPAWSIVMIGPTAKVDPNDLPYRKNIFWVGRREYEQLPNYAKAFDVCLMPFALNEATEFINPTKALEYMAAGRPVVSSAVPDVVSNFGKFVDIARTHEEFIELCRRAIEQPDQRRIERGLELARQNGWDAIVEKLEQHVHEALKRKPVARKAGRASRLPGRVSTL